MCRNENGEYGRELNRGCGKEQDNGDICGAGKMRICEEEWKTEICV